MFSRYFEWLQKGSPTGEVEKYPQLDKNGQSSLKGLYVVGDLTGIPLLKLAADSGAEKVRFLDYDADFISVKGRGKAEGILDLLIVGGGPAGVSAAIEADKRNLDYSLVESGNLFNTIENFPKGKPILIRPAQTESKSELNMHDCSKEELLEDLKSQLKERDLNIKSGVNVSQISRHKSGYLELETNTGSMKAQRVLLAIGKSGNARQLKVTGEDLDKVSNRLFDPADFQSKNILVVGGGDSAIEATIALAKEGNTVYHSYRKASFARPKEENVELFNKLTEEGKIQPLFSSQVKSITELEVTLSLKDKTEKTIANDAVFTLIGRELPTAFFKKSGILMEGEKSKEWWTYLVTMLSFFTMLYFGKSGWAIDVGGDGFTEKLMNLLKAPLKVPQQWSLKGGAWYATLNFILGWVGLLAFTITGILSLKCMLQKREKYFSFGWPLLKYLYLIVSAIGFTYIYIKYHLFSPSGSQSWVENTTHAYSLLYCTTMILFGIRRAIVKKTRYIKLQMFVLCFIQLLFLYLIPFFLYDWAVQAFELQGNAVLKELFPNGRWSSFSYILFWPLTMWEFGGSTFWTYFPFVQTFGILFVLVKYFGKGAFCGWICSCGGMAETLGDEYRTLAPHGEKAKKYENIGQWILLFAMITTAILVFGKGTLTADIIKHLYKIFIDVFFAGVLGLGVYFFMGGRVWCRFGCPLAALMHIYTRFSKYRIVAEKKKCISCNICTKVCHMGIDVMNFANKGKAMNDVECVRCSTCITSCPMDVLSFATLEKGDSDNQVKLEIPEYGKDSWKAGLK